MTLPATTTTPRVSIIMIFLNAGQFIDEAIASVLAQTFTDWELLLVDDGSSDHSTQIALEYSRRDLQRIRYIDHPQHQNLGMSASRNAGLRVARGDYVAFLDADDVYESERLERHLQILQENPQVTMVQSILQYWHSWRDMDDGTVPDTLESPVPVALHTPIRPPVLFALMLQSEGATVPGICSVTLRRNDLLALGGFEDAFRSTYEDQVMHAKIYLSKYVYVTDECLARYRQHAQSTLHVAGSASDYTPSRPHAARLRYLTWLEAYLRQQEIQNPLVWSSMNAALWPYRHPWAWRLNHSPQEILRMLRPLAERLLPRALIDGLVRWRGRQKDAAAATRARQASARITTITDAHPGDSNTEARGRTRP